MSSKTKIVVLRMKEIIYTAIFAGLAILLITLCFIMEMKILPKQMPQRHCRPPMFPASTAPP